MAERGFDTGNFAPTGVQQEDHLSLGILEDGPSPTHSGVSGGRRRILQCEEVSQLILSPSIHFNGQFPKPRPKRRILSPNESRSKRSAISAQTSERGFTRHLSYWSVLTRLF